MLWKCCKNIVDVALFFFKFLTCDFGNHYFFFLPFLAMALPQLPIFFFLFRQCHCHIWFSLRALTLRAPTRAAGMGRRNFGDGVAENKKFLSPTFYLSLSNFCWISAMVLPQFTFFPQIAKKVETVLITPINFKFSNIQPKDSLLNHVNL